VKKKAGNAVVRNKIKRQLRELFKSKSIDMAGLSMVVIVSENGSAIGSSYKSSSIAIDKFIDFLAKN
jgi:ribonuclease P protein component